MILSLENHLTSFERSKRLKELGVPQESYFCWSKAMDNKVWRVENSQFFKFDKRRDVSAYLSSELGEMLPAGFTNFISQKNLWWCETELEPYCGGKRKINFKANTEAEARGKMLEYLIVNKLVDPKTLGF